MSQTHETVCANPLVLRLEHGARLTAADQAKLLALTGDPRRVAARVDLISENEQANDVHLVLQGFACRYKVLADGSRSIMAFLVPGDFSHFQQSLLGAMDHSIGTLTPSLIVDIPKAEIDTLIATNQRLAQAFCWASLVDFSIMSEWLASMGRRSADRQLAHLFCELLTRLTTVGFATGTSFELPLTQEEIGDTVGISSVHVNRILQQLRDEGLISQRGKMLKIEDLPRLTTFAGFNPNYLHLSPR
ncbi:MAG TPA: Crp/Fnr family transcriptional regulator [Methylovirgula sp.]